MSRFRRSLMVKKGDSWDYDVDIASDAQINYDVMPLGMDTISGNQYRITFEYEWTFDHNSTSGTYHQVRFPYTYNICKTYPLNLSSSKSGNVDWTFTANNSSTAARIWQASGRYIHGNLKVKNYHIEEV